MTLDELEEALEEILPGFSIGEDEEGQLIIFTNLAQTEDGELVDFESEEEEDLEIDPDFEPLEEEDDPKEEG